MEKTKIFGALEKFIAVFLCIALLFAASGAWAARGVEERVIRLHVRANSDSPEDQQIKLAVRDAVLELVGDLCADARSTAEAQERIEPQLGRIEDAARAVLADHGFDYGAQARLLPEDFPERDYGSFTLPAGRYVSLSVRLGSGQGHNWWCIVFPFLCGAQYSENAAQTAGLTPLQSGLIRSDDVKIKFRVAEYYRRIARLLS